MNIECNHPMCVCTKCIETQKCVLLQKLCVHSKQIKSIGTVKYETASIMSLNILILLSAALLQQQQCAHAANATLNPLTVRGKFGDGTCPTQERRAAAIQRISVDVQNIIANLYNSGNSNCGDGPWYRVAYLNMSVPSQQCPYAWRENNTNGIRSCRRPLTSCGSCPGTSYSTAGRQYSKVCGRINGYEIGSTDAFGHMTEGKTIDSHYVHGVSVTHGIPRNHIWTFAAGVSEGGYAVQGDNCPCADPSNPGSRFPPSFVGDNYYCESGNPTDTFVYDHFYSGDLLWDGQQCEGQCCSDGKSPPWFSVNLTAPTTDDIEVRICIPQPSHDDIALQLIELYVQ